MPQSRNHCINPLRAWNADLFGAPAHHTAGMCRSNRYRVAFGFDGHRDVGTYIYRSARRNRRVAAGALPAAAIGASEKYALVRNSSCQEPKTLRATE